MPGYKAAKDRLALRFGGTASGKVKLKPLNLPLKRAVEP